jgi:transposase
MGEITTVGADLAKEVIVVCAADATGRPVYFKQLSCAGFAEWAAKLPPCLIGMEACSSAHHWARYLAGRGHTPQLMAAELVEPFRMSRGAKSDRNDAEAILCAVRQPGMRFVAIKSVDQQAMLAWHRARAGYLEERTALLNRTPLRRSRLEQWVVALHGRAGYHKTLVAIANKHLRTVWAILAYGENYDPNAWRHHPWS